MNAYVGEQSEEKNMEGNLSPDLEIGYKVLKTDFFILKGDWRR